MSKCESIGGHRYCTVIVMRKSRYVFIFLHKTKDEIQAVWTKCLNTLGDKHKLKTVRCDGAGEYISQKFRSWMLDQHGISMQFSSPHEQHQNGLSEKTIDLLTRRMRAGLAHSGLPTSFWSSALIMAADTMNVTPHKDMIHHIMRIMDITQTCDNSDHWDVGALFFDPRRYSQARS
jgi:hypothetical protein